MTHTSFISFPFKLEREAPPFEDQEIKYPEVLVRHFLKEYTKKGQNILDPFAGLGTTLFVTEEMKRIPYGIEAERERFEWTAGQMTHWQNIIHGDADDILNFGFPKMDFCMTSPPYMPKHHKWNPLYSGNPKYAGYKTYLKRMEKIFANIARCLKRNAVCVVQVDNLRGKTYTPLVRDISIAVEKSLRLDDEIIVQWKNAKPDYPYTHCLIFKNTQQ